jgi:hypothetical protein
MNTAICTAINNKYIIEFYYDGGFRTIEPHCHGYTQYSEVLRGFQTSGFSQSGETSGWKLFDVSKILNLSVTPNHFYGPRPGYNPNDTAMSRIHCHV